MIRSLVLLIGGGAVLLLAFTAATYPGLVLLGALALLAGLVSAVVATVKWSRQRRAELLGAIERAGQDGR